MKKLNIVVAILLIIGLTSCNQEKQIEQKQNNNQIEQKENNNQAEIENIVDDFDEELLKEVVEPLLEIK